ncbi:MAG: hypothetical protein QOG53_3091 [Frankiales bacterium]|nr:hypothetical protein [Frankiales bacterium]
MTTLRRGPAAKFIGLTAVVSSALYLLSDVIEVLQGGFSSGQLWLTLVAETAVPIFVVGLAVLQRPRLGRLGELSAWTYAYSYVFFTGTVVYALVNGTKDYAALTDKLGAVMVVHGALMVLAGLGFGYAVRRARLLPPWTAITLMAGVVLVALAQNLPDGAQLAAAAIRDLGFAGMGVGVLRIGASSVPVDRTRRRYVCGIPGQVRSAVPTAFVGAPPGDHQPGPIVGHVGHRSRRS